MPWRWRSVAGLAAFMIILATPLGIELGQMLLPEKFPDTTDWVLESLGGILGYVLFGMVRTRFTPAPRRSPPVRHSRTSGNPGGSMGSHRR
jgi:glycopeptide antibiotics resistance protein